MRLDDFEEEPKQLYNNTKSPRKISSVSMASAQKLCATYVEVLRENREVMPKTCLNQGVFVLRPKLTLSMPVDFR